MKICVCIPCYNCEKQIVRVLKGFQDARNLYERVFEIIVIDNRSTDQTVNAAISAAKLYNLDKVKVVRNDDNYGLGGSHKVAFLHGIETNADYVAILHGDNQASTEELGLLIERAESDQSLSAVLGSRFMPKSNLSGYSLTRTIGNYALDIFYTLVTLKTTRDLGSGLNLFKLSELRDKRFLGFSDRFTFNIDLLLDYYCKKSSIVFVPITWSETDQVSNAKAFSIGLTALETVLLWRFNMQKFSSETKSYTFEHVGD